jgi:hypothetical protein
MLFFPQLLTCLVVNGSCKNEIIYVPRIDMIFAASNTVKMRRIQFPVRLAWCGTVVLVCSAWQVDLEEGVEVA